MMWVPADLDRDLRCRSRPTLRRPREFDLRTSIGVQIPDAVDWVVLAAMKASKTGIGRGAGPAVDGKKGSDNRRE